MLIEDSNPSHIGDYKLQNKIGKGSFASVFKAIHIGSNRVCAIKRIDKSCLLTQSENDDNLQYDLREVEVIRREIRISKKADHPLIVHFYETFEDDDYLYIVMEYIEGESMLSYVNSNGKLDENQARYFFKQLLSCVEYLHDQLHVTHRDLKAENIIIDVHNNIRLIDFGLSTEFSGDDQTSNLMMNTVCGSPAYAAPELVQGNEYTNSVDIWSCGVVLYSMVLASLPFYDENITKLFHKVVFEDPFIPKTLSPELSNLLSQLLQKNPSERITIEKIKESTWYNSSGTNPSLNIDFSFLLDSSLKVSNSQLSHDVIFQLRRSGYQIDQNSDDVTNESEKPSISEDGLRDDIINFRYSNSISTAYRILCTSRVNQTVLKKINAIKYSASSISSSQSSQDSTFGFNSPIKPIGPALNTNGNKRTRRYSSVCQYNNNTSLLSPITLTKNSNTNSITNVNLEKENNMRPILNSNTNGANSARRSNTITSSCSNPNVNSTAVPNFSSISPARPNIPRPNVNSLSVPSFSSSTSNTSISDNNSNSNNTDNANNNFADEGILKSPRESFPSNKHEVKFAQLQFFPIAKGAQPQRRHMSFSSRSTGPSIVVPKVSFAQSNFA